MFHRSSEIFDILPKNNSYESDFIFSYTLPLSTHDYKYLAFEILVEIIEELISRNILFSVQ